MRERRSGGRAVGRTAPPGHRLTVPLRSRPPVRPSAGPPANACQRCHFLVPAGATGCKNPCPNCGTIYPLGDCSD